MVKNFIQTVSTHFESIKKINNIEMTMNNAVYLSGNQGFLLPLCKIHIHDDEICDKLTNWRNDFMFAFQTQFKATPERTCIWLENFINNAPTRLLYLIMDLKNNPIGHIGLANPDQTGRIELDNVIRGESNVEPGIMANAISTLSSWCKNTFFSKQIFLRVLEDNKHAVNFYKKLGFKINKREPLKKIESPDLISYIPTSQNDEVKFLLHMSLS